MKKSTLLFIVGNILVLSVPIIFMMALRFKINRGEVIDIKAEFEAQTKKEKLVKFDTVELNSKYDGVYLSIYMDTINKISIDTGDYRYVSYKIKDNTLVIDYDFVKDSLDHPEIRKELQKSRTLGNDENIGFRRSVSLFINSSLKKIKLNNGSAGLTMDKINLQNNDLEIIASKGDFTFEVPDYNDIDYESNSPAIPCDSIPFKIKANLNKSNFSANLRYVKQLEIESRNSDINTYSMDFNHYDLKLDDKTTSYIEVTKLRKINIQYLK